MSLNARGVFSARMSEMVLLYYKNRRSYLSAAAVQMSATATAVQAWSFLLPSTTDSIETSLADVRYARLSLFINEDLPEAHIFPPQYPKTQAHN